MNFDLQFFGEDAIEHQSPNQLRKGIRSLKKKIELHLAKIENPAKYCEDWHSRDERAKLGLIRHWRKEISDTEESIQNRIDELAKRGESL
ncbi:MAG: hypothetical protein IKE46_03470 [Selenomonadaceae bacterium]|nr:hypothetical protein [Selenomonadaceae bacterium]